MDPEAKAKMEIKMAKARHRKDLMKQEADKAIYRREDNEMRTLYTWGDGGRGQLGHRELYTEAYFKQTNPRGMAKLRQFTRLECPRLVESLVGWTTPKELGHISMIKANGCQSGLLTEKGMLMTWGSGDNGRIGHGDGKMRSTPTPLQNLQTDTKNKTKSGEQKVPPLPNGRLKHHVPAGNVCPRLVLSRVVCCVDVVCVRWLTLRSGSTV